MANKLPPIWRGQEYERGGRFGKRVLILGESTYPSPGESTWRYNVAIPEDHISGRVRDGFRTKLLRAFLNTDCETPTDIAAFWHSVAFFNYVTKDLVGARLAPTQTDWTHHQPLYQHVRKLRPQLLIVLGFRLWNQLEIQPPCRSVPGPLVAGAGRPQTCYYGADDGNPVLAYGMRHPSSAFSWRKEHPRLMEVLRLA